MQLKELHRIGCKLGTDIMAVNHCISPPFFLFPWDGGFAVYEAPWQRPEDKPMYIAQMRDILLQGVDSYTFVTEAWFATVNMKTAPELMNVAPRNRSQREDVLFISSRHRNGECYSTKYTVEYDTDGKATLSKPETSREEMFGLMGNLFHDEPAMASGAEH